jgi:hypothetical protein
MVLVPRMTVCQHEMEEVRLSGDPQDPDSYAVRCVKCHTEPDEDADLSYADGHDRTCETCGDPNCYYSDAGEYPAMGGRLCLGRGPNV